MKQYGKLCTVIYDLDKPLAQEKELSLYLQEMGSCDKRVLEPMCGSGRFYIPLLQKGYDISGFDLSDEMLKACRKKCKEMGLDADLFQADLRSFTASESYDCVVIPVGSLSLITDQKDIQKSFSRIYNCLREGGTYVLSFQSDLDHKDDISEWQETMRYRYRDMDLICKMKQRVQDGFIDMKLLYELRKNDELIEKELQDFPHRLYTAQEMKHYLQEAGFSSIRAVCSDDTEDDYTVLSCKK